MISRDSFKQCTLIIRLFPPSIGHCLRWAEEGHFQRKKKRGDAAHSIGGLDEGVVDGDDLDVGVLNSVAEDDTSNSTEAVDADLDGSHCS